MIKVCLTNRGEDSETPWAEDLGPASGPDGSRKVKLVNVPFLHAKPTWGDVIVVSPVDDGFLTWDRNNVWWKKVPERIVEDGGRWAMIVDYAPRAGDVSGDKAFAALAKACEPVDVVCEGAWGPRGDEPGRAYLAVRNEATPESVMAALRTAKLPCDLIQIHPELKRSGKPQQPPPLKKKPEKSPATAKGTRKLPALANPAPKSAVVAKPAAKSPARAKSAAMPAAMAKPGARSAATSKPPATSKSVAMAKPTAKSGSAKSATKSAAAVKAGRKTTSKKPATKASANKPKLAARKTKSR